MRGFSGSDITSGFYRDAVDRGTVLSVGGRDLRVAEFRGESLQTTPFPMNTGTLVVPDEAVPAGSAILQSVLDVQCASDEDEAAFGEMMDAVADTDNPDTWPITLSMTRAEVIDQSISCPPLWRTCHLPGFVLVIACAAILRHPAAVRRFR